MATPIPASKFPLSPYVTTTNTTTTATKLLFFPPKPLGSFKPLRSSSATEPTEEEPGPVEPVKTALAKAEAYRKSKKSTSGESEGSANRSPEVPASAKLAMEKAREYKQNTGQEKMNVVDTGKDLLKSKVNKKEELTVSSIDFLGFGFSEKKSYRGMPPGLTPAVEPLLDGEIPEVEFIVGDASKFEVASPRRISSDEDTNNTDLYKPKVSTWGVFPRPNNISKTAREMEEKIL